MVGDSYGSDSQNLSPLHQLRGYQDPVTEEGVCVKINHLFSHLIFAKVLWGKLFQVFFPFFAPFGFIQGFRLPIQLSGLFENLIVDKYGAPGPEG